MPARDESDNSEHEDQQDLRHRRDEDQREERIRKRPKLTRLSPYLKLACWLACSYNPFLFFPLVFDVGLRANARVDEEEVMIQMSEKRRLELLTAYKMILDAVPEFANNRAKYAKDPEKLEDLARMMNSGACAARSDDVGSLRNDGLAYIALDLPLKVIHPAIPLKSLKAATRGFNHQVLGRLLCPIKYLKNFNNPNERILEKLAMGTLPVTSRDLPVFLFKNPETWTPEEIDKGLCQGPLLVWVWRHIFTSPSSAAKDSQGPIRTKAGQAKLNDLERVTPRTIAYAALHTRWFLCSEDNWKLEDKLFNKEDFFNAIVEMFEQCPGDEWSIDTLEWWNEQVFKGTMAENQHTEVPKSNDISDMFEQCRLRRELAMAANVRQDGDPAHQQQREHPPREPERHTTPHAGPSQEPVGPRQCQRAPTPQDPPSPLSSDIENNSHRGDTGSARNSPGPLREPSPSHQNISRARKTAAKGKAVQRKKARRN